MLAERLDRFKMMRVRVGNSDLLIVSIILLVVFGSAKLPRIHAWLAGWFNGSRDL